MCILSKDSLRMLILPGGGAEPRIFMYNVDILNDAEVIVVCIRLIEVSCVYLTLLEAFQHV